MKARSHRPNPSEPQPFVPPAATGGRRPAAGYLVSFVALLALALAAPSAGLGTEAGSSRGRANQPAEVLEVVASQDLAVAHQWVLTAQAWTQRALIAVQDVEPGATAVPPQAPSLELRQEIGYLIEMSFELYSVWEPLSGEMATLVAANPQDTYLALLDQLLRSQLLSMDILARLFRKAMHGEVVDEAEFALTRDVARLWQGISSLLIVQLQERTGSPFANPM